jgi:hypothetical protein
MANQPIATFAPFAIERNPPREHCSYLCIERPITPLIGLNHARSQIYHEPTRVSELKRVRSRLEEAWTELEGRKEEAWKKNGRRMEEA